MFLITLETDKVIGINNGYGTSKNKHKFKKPETRDWQHAWQLAASNFRHMFLDYSPKEQYIKMEVYWYNPNFYKKDKSMNKRSGDVDGTGKFIIDGVFSGIGKGLDIDDAYLKHYEIIQLPTNKDHHSVSVVVHRSNLLDLEQVHKKLQSL